MKYWILFKTFWQNSWVYPVSFVMWRFRQFISTFAAITVWITIFASQGQVFGYSRETMVTYIFLTGFLQSMILATQTGGLADQIYTGAISNNFVKPFNVLLSLVTQDLADKAMNFTFVVVETAVLIAIFRPIIVFPGLSTFLVFLLATMLGAILLFFIMLLFGVMGFWSPETWGPRFLFYMFVDFTAGKLYPLNILPNAVQQFLFFTPFPYLSYVQTQIFLNHYSTSDIVRTFSVLSVWIVGTAGIFYYFWHKGLKEYGAVGH